MARRSNPKAATKRDRMPGLYGELLETAEGLLAEIEADAEYCDPRVKHSDYTPNLNNAQRAAVAKAKRQRDIETLKRRIGSLKGGESQLVPVQQIRRLPEAERIEWLQDEGRTGSAPYLVRVHSDDRIEVGQTWDQFQEQQRIISLGYPVGRVDESGDWIPRVQNPLTGQWEDIEPGEILDA
jgi:hypothetical protein